MKHQLFQLLCLTGVLPAALSVLQSVPHLYYLIQTPKSWSDAQTYCRTNYADLATIISTDDWIRLQKDASKYNITSAAWVGLYNDINTWRWSYQNISPSSYMKWLPKEPNNEKGNEACGALDSYGNWWDVNCLNQKPFLCFNETSRDQNRFIGVSSTMESWLDAQAYCRQHYTDLAIVTSNYENSQLQKLVIGQWSAWFGLFRDTWKWSDGSNASEINWIPGQPDNNQTDENCGFVYDGELGDGSCSKLRPFFCHIVPPVRERQLVKVRLTSNHSVSDDLLKSSIVQMFEQKLKEQGLLENTTLTWRIQRDGNIFHKTQEKTEDSVDNTSRVLSDCSRPV